MPVRQRFASWSGQPQTAVVPAQRWLDRGLVYASQLGPGVYDVVGSRPQTTVGTRSVVGPWGLARGFGSTYGVGSTDQILTGLTSHALQRTYMLTAVVNGTGGGGFGRFFEKRVAGSQVELLFINSGPSIEYSRTWTGGPNYGRWSVSTGSAPRKIAVTYDASSTNNYPRLCLDGDFPLRISDYSGSTGSALTNTDAYVIGNRANDNARNFDGAIWDFAVFDSILSDDEILELQADASLLWEEQRIWVPVTGTPPGYTHPTLSNATATDITATSFRPRVTYTF